MQQIELFWNYVKDFSGEAPLDLIFSNYIKNSSMPNIEAKVLWAQIEKDIEDVFTKQAVTTVYPDGKIVVDSDPSADTLENPASHNTLKPEQGDTNHIPDNTLNKQDSYIENVADINSSDANTAPTTNIKNHTDLQSSESDLGIKEKPKNVFDLAYQNISNKN